MTSGSRGDAGYYVEWKVEEAEHAVKKRWGGEGGEKGGGIIGKNIE